MARVTYERGIKCKRCGQIYVSIDRFQHYVLCQSCGEHLMDVDWKNKKVSVTKNADIITVRVIHKLFRDIYEEV